MSAHFITIGDESIALLLAGPNRNSPVKVSPFLPDSVEPAISKRETRQNWARSFRHTLEYTADVLDTRAMTDLQLWLLRLHLEPVAVPLWNDFVEITSGFNTGATSLAIAYGPPVRFGKEWVILSPDTSTFEIVRVASCTLSTLTLEGGCALNWPAGTCIYPLLFGRLVERPQWEAGHDEWIHGTIKVEENSAFARAINAFPRSVPIVGSNITEFALKPLLTAVPSRVRQLNWTETKLLSKQIGFLREAQQYDGPPQHNARGYEMEFYCGSRTEIADLENLFRDRMARVKTFLLPTWNGDLRLAADLPIVGNTSFVSIEPSRYTDALYSTNPGAPYLCLITVNGANSVTSIDPIRINDADTMHAAFPIATSHPKLTTILSHLILVRFAEAKIEWNYITDGKATVRIKFIEQPSEYTDPPADLPEPLFLYRVIEPLPTPLVTRYTNYENTVTIAGEDWISAPYEHGAIVKSTKPGNTRAEIISWGGDFDGNPLAKLLPGSLNARPLSLEILEADAADLDAPLVSLFFGDVMGINKRGVDWRATCVWGGRVFKRDLLRQRVRRGDNNVMFSPATHIDKDAFAVHGRFAPLDGTTTVRVTHLDVDGQDANWFSGGWLETGVDENHELRSIKHSEPDGDDQIVTIDRPFEHAVDNQDVVFYPGYDGSLEQWLEKFADGDPTNFGGYKFVPDTNPQVKAMEAEQPSGAKK